VALVASMRPRRIRRGNDPRRQSGTG